MSGSHARHHPERDEEAVLGAEHELADAREPTDPCGLTEGVLVDVSARLVADRGVVRHLGFALGCCVGSAAAPSCTGQRGSASPRVVGCRDLHRPLLGSAFTPTTSGTVLRWVRVLGPPPMSRAATTVAPRRLWPRMVT